MKNILYLFLFLQTGFLLAQDKTQTIRGQVIDKDNQQPLVGATITLVNSVPLMGVLTDSNGVFMLEKVPLGRQIIECTFIGYAPFRSEAFILNSVKEWVVQIDMKESATEMNAVVISSSHNTNAPLNELSVVSTRSFSVEETERIPTGVNDPGRMALSFSGVQQGQDDSENEILIRGNSSFGLLWRLEGIDIPAPNHFARPGSSGGGITVFSAQLLSRSDFSTGGMPAEYGNAISGAMDIHFRKGNADKREYRAKIGLLGLDFATEGPLKASPSPSKGGGSSYLVNYRYSTLGLLNKMGFYVVGERIANDFQDLSFNIALGGNKKTTYTVFGIAGLSTEHDMPVEKAADRKPGVANNWQDRYLGSNMGTLGWTFTHSIDEKTYLKGVVALMSNYIFKKYDTLNTQDLRYRYNTQNYYDTRLAATLTYNRKINTELRFKGGIIAQQVFYKYDKTVTARPTSIDITERNRIAVAQSGNENTQIMQLYGQFNYEPNSKWTLNGGLHVLYLLLNKTPSVEPRLSMKYQFTPKQSIGLAYGLHGQILPFSVYLYNQKDTVNGVIKTSTPNHDSKMIQAHHFILSYNLYTDNAWKLSVEPYFQRLIHVPIEPTAGSLYWMLNEQGNVPDFKVISEGKGLNYGIDVSIERFFNNKFYFLLNTSVFKSTYEVLNNVTRNSRLNTSFGSGLTLGREFTLKNKATLQIGSRVLFNGGFRYSPLDVAASAQKHDYIPLKDAEWTKQAAPYFRIDSRVAYRFNKKRYAGSISLDIQNLTNHVNVSSLAYDSVKNALYSSFQPGGFTPVIAFQYDF